MERSLPLRPDVHAAVLGDDVVILDIAADAYLCVVGGAAQLRPTADGRALRPLDRPAADEIAASGLIDRETRSASPVARPPALPTAGLPVAPAPTLTVRDAFNLAGSLFDLALHYRGRPLAAILAFARRDSAVARRGGADPLRIARLFQAVAVWLPVPGKCLARNFVLLRFLQRSGCDAQWVFGVRTWPFTAHCWLQAEGVALDDPPDRLRAYQALCVI